MKDSTVMNLMSNGYLVGCKFSLVKAITFYFILFDLILFTTNSLFAKEWLQAGFIFEVMTLSLLVCVLVYRISQKFKDIVSKIIPAVTPQGYKKYLQKNLLSCFILIVTDFVFSLTYFTIKFLHFNRWLKKSNQVGYLYKKEYKHLIEEHLNTFFEAMQHKEFWGTVWCTLIGVLILSGIIAIFKMSEKVKTIATFRVNSNTEYHNDVKAKGVEIVKSNQCIYHLDLLKENVFFEDFGMILIYNTETKVFKALLETQFDSIIIRKNDNSILITLKFNGKWEHF